MKKNKSKKYLTGYIAGFLLSITLTITAFLVASIGLYSGWALTYVILALAITQMTVQVVFFLHIMEEKKPRFNLLTFNFMVMVVAILVIGSVWIMHNLDYNMMPHLQEKKLIEDSNIYIEKKHNHQ